MLPVVLYAADAARIDGDLKVNGIHFNDASTLYSSNQLMRNVYMVDGFVASNGKPSYSYVWPVRAGQ
jgi:hypothetical protein